jgi:hypothetical protein
MSTGSAKLVPFMPHTIWERSLNTRSDVVKEYAEEHCGLKLAHNHRNHRIGSSLNSRSPDMVPDLAMVVTMIVPKINMRGHLVTVYAISVL